MAKSIKFTDGSTITILTDEVISKGENVDTAFTNSVLLTEGKTLFTENLHKTDLDGNNWTFSTYGNVTIKHGSTTYTLSYGGTKHFSHFKLTSDETSLVLVWYNLNNNTPYTSYFNGKNGDKSFTEDIAYNTKNRINFSFSNILQGTKEFSHMQIVASAYTSTLGYPGGFHNNQISERVPLNIFSNSISEYEPPIKPTDPYDKGGSSTDGGGGGTFGGGNTIFGGNSDSIDVPPLPTASASAAGFITLFNPTLGQLNNLASYMWSDLFSLDTFKKIFADPMDCILGLSIVPVKPASAGTSAVKIGNISTDVSMNKTSSQYVAVDCGTIDVKEYWGAYLDYAPYTQCEIYLPYVGTKQISVDDVMNKAVHVVYHVDILSGACNAYVKCGDSVLYTFVGQCSSSIPISGNDWTNVLNGAISVAGKIGLAMATGGATALMSGLGAASSIISSSKPTVERSGAMSSTGGLLGIQKPYLILTRPKQVLPENQNKYTGYPSFITMKLSDCTGYTEIDSIHLENMSCTDEEALEIENLLKSGVIF